MSRTVTSARELAPATRVPVVLSYGPLGLVRATAHGIGDDSICVDTGRISLLPHTEVEVTFSFGRNSGRRAMKVPARVAGREGPLSRLVFVAKEPGLIAALRKMIPVFATAAEMTTPL